MVINCQLLRCKELVCTPHPTKKNENISKLVVYGCCLHLPPMNSLEGHWAQPSVSWLYLARRSERHGAPVLICPVPGRSHGAKSMGMIMGEVSHGNSLVKVDISIWALYFHQMIMGFSTDSLLEVFNLMEIWQVFFRFLQTWRSKVHQTGPVASKYAKLPAFVIIIGIDSRYVDTARCTTTHNTNIYRYTSWDACNSWIERSEDNITIPF